MRPMDYLKPMNEIIPMYAHVLNQYRELQQLDISIEARDQHDALMSVQVEGDQYTIEVSELIRRASVRAIQGAFAHELSHVYREHFGLAYADDVLEERACDELAIEKGFGPHLRSVRAFHNARFSPFPPEDGLTYKEICARIRYGVNI